MAWFQNQYADIIDFIGQGGMVMVPLMVLSLIMWFMILERALFFRRLHHKNMSAAVALEHINGTRMPDPAQYRGAVSLLVAEYLRSRTGNPALDRHFLDAAAAGINRRLNAHLAAIGVLATMAPLMGLLGTVTGMISTFDVLAVYGTGNAKAMAGGISEALITTQTGLIVTIPGLYMKGFLDRRAQNLCQRITRIGYYLRQHIG